jgi:hypothetical protein
MSFPFRGGARFLGRVWDERYCDDESGLSLSDWPCFGATACFAGCLAGAKAGDVCHGDNGASDACRPGAAAAQKPLLWLRDCA